MVNSNAAWLSRRLSALGFRVARHVVLPDDLPAMVREFRSAFGRAELVVLTGGLGR
ncbi:MAG: competence damage-inducible protein A, partial [Candidatus Brocadiae bacterium]|nr:competence damage-inducible protein A [Candidatus Brocadiia bacterium]